MEPIFDAALESPQPWSMTEGDRVGVRASEPNCVTPLAAAGKPSPLTMATIGDRLWVIQIKGGHGVVRRLTDLGIVRGSAITVVSQASGAVVVALQGCRIGLGAGMAHRIMVTTTPPEFP